ncbi:MAG: Flp pilus assembly complex ATPase component TadA [Phreatobacter sp.]|nr:Flp pilus assembly complex ATPase component TadA [Phreatobacter sp.]
MPAPAQALLLNKIPIIPFNGDVRSDLRKDKVTFDQQLSVALVPQPMRQHIIILSDHSIVLTAEYRDHPVMRQVIGDAARKGHVLKRAIEARITDITLLIRGMDVEASVDGAQDTEREILSLLEQAYRQKATDIQIHADGDFARVRLVVNDQFRVIAEWKRDKAERFLAATYNLCSVNDGAYNDQIAQGARLTSSDRIKLPGNIETVRIEVAPTASQGRCMVMRLLLGGRSHDRKTLEGLGYDREHILAINKILEHPFGACYIAGPTGSGKSTTLAVCLEDLFERREGRNNIVTIEDPPEYKIAGAVQYPVANAMDFASRSEAFAKSFRSVLRSKPHVIMVGEIRDGVAANLLIEAAQSGHQAFTSIHAKDSFTIIPRLAQMGAQRYLVSDSTLTVGLIFQRLIRRLCPHCSVPLDEASDVHVSYAEGEFLRLFGYHGAKNMRFRNPLGCPHCAAGASALEVGYQGLTVAAEVVNPNDAMLDYLMEGRRLEAMQEWFHQETALTAFEHGIRKMAAGILDPRDVFEKLFDPVQAEYLADHPDRLDFVLHGRRDAHGNRVIGDPTIAIGDLFSMRASA